MRPIIELKGITKIFQGEDGPITALSGVDLTVEEGDIFGIIGLSGAGKSTLVRCINLLERPTEGTVIVDGEDLTALKKKSKLLEARRKIGMIFQGYNLLEQRTAIKNVCFPLEIKKMKKADALKKAKELLELVGLSDKLNAYPSQLSGGQKQRVAIARALASDPKVLLCDEATSALDPSTTDAILALLKDINRTLGLTIVIITHEMKVIDKICNKVAVIDDSKIAECGLTDEIFIDPKSAIARKLILPLSAETPSANGKKLRLIFDGTSSDEPVISLLALNCGITANVSYASTKDVNGKLYGEMVIQISNSSDALNKAKRFFEGKGVICKEEE